MESDDHKVPLPEHSTPNNTGKVCMLVCVVIQSNFVVSQLNFVRQHSAAGKGKVGEAYGPGCKVWEASSPVVKVGGAKKHKRQAKKHKKN